MIALRADVVGSLLRPGYLMRAREQHAAGVLALKKLHALISREGVLRKAS